MRRAMAMLLALGALAAGVPASAQEQEADGREPTERSAVDDINPAVDFSTEPTRGRELAESPGDAPTANTPRASAAESPRPGNGGAIDTLNLGTTSITGNQELPRVLYIVPWKQSDLGDLVGRPVDTLLDEVLAPIDPEVFERHVDYYETLYGESQEDSSQ